MSSTIGKVIQTKAVVCWEPGKVSVETLNLDPPKDNEIRVKIKYNGLCHSDLHVIDNKLSGFEIFYPIVLGHEGSGIVESIGPNCSLSDLQIGDHVLVLFQPYCGSCDWCKDKRTNLCMMEKVEAAVQKDGTSRFSTLDGKVIYAVSILGCMSEYIVVPETRILKINPKINLDTICLVSCAIGTGYGSATKIGKVTADSTVVIFGLGTIGMATAIGCKLSGAKMIIGVDINPDKFELAKKFGFTHFINPRTDLDKDQTIDKKICEITNSPGVDFSFECIGLSQTATDAINSAAPGIGKVILVGFVNGEITFHAMNLLAGKTLTGGLFGGFKGRADLMPLVELCASGKINLDDFVTKRTNKIEDIHIAIDDLRKGKVLRTVFEL